MSGTRLKSTDAPYHDPERFSDTRPRRPLRILGLHGWIPWRLVRTWPGGATYVLAIEGETAELEDFGEV